MSFSSESPTQATGPYLIWCHEYCNKPTGEVMGDWIRHIADSVGYTPRFYRKAYGLAAWLNSDDFLPDVPYVLVTDWREFKPSQIFLKKVARERHPLRTFVVVPDSKQCAKACNMVEAARRTDGLDAYVARSAAELSRLVAQLCPAHTKDTPCLDDSSSCASLPAFASTSTSASGPTSAQSTQAAFSEQSACTSTLANGCDQHVQQQRRQLPQLQLQQQFQQQPVCAFSSMPISMVSCSSPFFVQHQDPIASSMSTSTTLSSTRSLEQQPQQQPQQLPFESSNSTIELSFGESPSNAPSPVSQCPGDRASFLSIGKEFWTPDVSGYLHRMFRDESWSEVVGLLQASVAQHYED